MCLLVILIVFVVGMLCMTVSFIVSHFDEVENICIDIQLPCLSKPQKTDFLVEYCKVTFNYNINVDNTCCIIK